MSFRDVEVVGGMVEAVIAGIARRHGMSHAALNALAVIEGSGGPLPSGEVSNRMHITTGTLTTVLDTLERKGYIQRLVDSTDRRRVLVDITPAAQSVLDKMLPEVQQLAAVVMSSLDDKTLGALRDNLAVVRDAIGNLPDDLPPPVPRLTPAKLRRS